MRREIKRDLLEHKEIQEIMLDNDFLRYLCQIQDDLLKKNNICTNKLNWAKKQELSERARRLSYQSRKDNIKIVSPRTVLYSWFNKEVKKMYDSSDKQPEKKKKGRSPIMPKFKQYIIQIAKDNPRFLSPSLNIIHSLVFWKNETALYKHRNNPTEEL